MALTNVYFMRHGESVANDKGLIAGSKDSKMTHRGILQVSQAAYYFRQNNIHFDLILSSPLSRCLDSAKNIADIIGYPEERIVVVKSLSERSFGSYEETPSSALDTANDLVIESNGGESEEKFMERMSICYKEIRNVSKSKQANLVLIVSHSWVYRGLHATMNEGYIPGDLWSQQGIKNANVRFLTKFD